MPIGGYFIPVQRWYEIVCTVSSVTPVTVPHPSPLRRGLRETALELALIYDDVKIMRVTVSQEMAKQARAVPGAHVLAMISPDGQFLGVRKPAKSGGIGKTVAWVAVATVVLLALIIVASVWAGG